LWWWFGWQNPLFFLLLIISNKSTPKPNMSDFMEKFPLKIYSGDI